jgi:predicted DNA-binding antitoxin AbrB/MazE fold protein
MIRAIYHNGVIRPLDSVPPEWNDGDEVMVERSKAAPTDVELDQWIAEVSDVAAHISDEDHARVAAAIAAHRAEAKKWARREMGLPE